MMRRSASRSMRPASLTSSRPLISSTPTLSRPTVGRSMSNRTRAMAAPMIAKSTSCWASAPMVAPTSSTMLSPRMVGQIAGNGRAVDVRHRAQAELRHRHQRAGIAGRNADIGLAVLDRFDRLPHGGFPAALTQRLAGLVVHRNGNVAMGEGGNRLDARQACQHRLDRLGFAEQQEADVGTALHDLLQGGQDDGRALVAPHHINGNPDQMRILSPARAAPSASPGISAKIAISWLRTTGKTAQPAAFTGFP